MPPGTMQIMLVLSWDKIVTKELTFVPPTDVTPKFHPSNHKLGKLNGQTSFFLMLHGDSHR